LAACQSTQIKPSTTSVQDQTVFTWVLAVPDDEVPAFPSPVEAALFAAKTQHPALQGAQVTNMIAIFADDQSVALRMKVSGNEFCQWYGVVGRIEEAALEWRASPANPCDPNAP
jgi:hypothetical protein